MSTECESCRVNLKDLRVRGFELLSDDGKIPVRATPNSAGYDFYAARDMKIHQYETIIVPTDVTAYMREDEYLDLRIRSGISGRLILANGAGVVDSDYYGKNIGFKVTNPNEQIFYIYKGDRIGQGIFCKYLLADNDTVLSDERVGGFGSSGK